MTIELSPERALELLREVIAEFGGDHVYTGPDGESIAEMGECFYVHGDKPGCIAGHVYHRAGLSLVQLQEQEYTHAATTEFVDLGITPAAAGLVVEAQKKQDEGWSWGEALAAAEKYYNDTIKEH